MNRADVIIPYNLTPQLKPPMRSILTGEPVTQLAGVPCLAGGRGAPQVILNLPANDRDRAAFRRGSAYIRWHSLVIFSAALLLFAAAVAVWVFNYATDDVHELRPWALTLGITLFAISVASGVIQRITLSPHHPRIAKNGEITLPGISAELAKEWKATNPGVTVRNTT